MRILLNGVRSFASAASMELRPLTLVVGENSAGKSTLLAMTDAVLNGRFLFRRPPFNVPPYQLGAFEDMASYAGGRSGRATKFSVGLEREESSEKVIATYESDEGQPLLTKLDFRHLDSDVSASFSGKVLRVRGRIGVETRRRANPEAPPGTAFEEVEAEVEVQFGGETAPNTEADWRFALVRAILESRPEEAGRNQMELLTLIRKLPIFSLGTNLGARSIAPVRTRPKRVYEAVTDQPDPEGDYIPFLLARTLMKGGATAEGLRRVLERFGTDSGLFTGIKPRRLSRRTLWPFQIDVDNSGPSKNLIDVGYGVSQALPIVVESFLPGPHTLLVQQPEVHLHPRAQAALGSLFAELAGQSHRRFVVETHSDYLIDRVRHAVVNKVLNSRDVLIVFVHRPRAKSKIHEIGLDDNGNVIGAPHSYRDFFLHEQQKFFN
jgi:hypothetical protein